MKHNVLTGMDPPLLRVSELYKRRQAKDAARLRAYNQILDTVHHRIRVQGNLPNSPCSLLYTIPPFVLGLPKIDLEDCVVYLVFQLRQSGFEVRYSYPNLLAISWTHHERSYITEQSPITQAMLAAQAAAPPPLTAAPKRRAPKAITAGPTGQTIPSQRTGMAGQGSSLAGPSQRRQKGVAFSVGNDKGPSVGSPSVRRSLRPSLYVSPDHDQARPQVGCGDGGSGGPLAVRARVIFAS